MSSSILLLLHSSKSFLRRQPVWLFAFLLAVTARAEPPAAEFFVSPTGNDLHAGTSAAPFATLDRARLAVRSVNATMGADIHVRLAPGDYPVSSPVVFGSADSGFNGHDVIYRADGPPGSARLVGGQAVTEWQHWQGGIFYADLGVPAFHTLYENGRRARKARFPNLQPDPTLPLARAGYLTTTGVNNSVRLLTYAAGAFDPSTWDISSAQVHIWSGGSWSWFTDTVPITSIDTSTRTITLAEDTRYRIYQNGRGSRFFIQGALALLDEPGEFHYDSASGRLYYWPMDGDPGAQQIIVPRVKRILSVNGTSASDRVRNIRFEGLGMAFTDFTGWYRHAHLSAGDSGLPKLYPQFDRQATLPHNREGAVVLENTEFITFDSCEILNTGYSGVFSYGANRHNSFNRCRVGHNGMCGFMFEGLYPGEGDVQTLNTVDNCLIHDIGELAGQGAGVQLTNASHHEISHCVIDSSVRYGVCIVAYVDIPLADIYAHSNHIHHIRITRCIQDSGDAGAINAWGLSDDPPYHINRFEQLIIDDTRAHPSMPDYPPNAVFMDNDSQFTELIDIDVRNSQWSAFRINGSFGHQLTNCSWQAGFNPNRINYDSIGIRADHPFPVAPIRLALEQVEGGIRLSWLPVANAVSYTVWSAESAAGPWQPIATGLATPSYVDAVPVTRPRHYHVTSTHFSGTESTAYSTVSVRPASQSELPFTTGLDVWFDATDMNGNGDNNSGWSDGNPLSTSKPWVNKGSAGNPNEYGFGSANAPVFRGTVAYPIGGTGPAVQFDRDNFTLPEFMDSPNVSIFAVVQRSGASTGQEGIFWDYGNTGNQLIYLAAAANGKVEGRARDSTGVTSIIATSTQTIGTDVAVLEMILDGQSLEAGPLGATVTATNAAYDSGTTWQGTFARPTIGSTAGTHVNDLRGNLFELLVFDHALTAANRAAVVNYLNNKYLEFSPEPATFRLVIAPAAAPATGFDLEWNSQAGKLYNLRASTDLAGPVAGWDLLEGNITATPPANSKNVPADGPHRFYAVEEFDAP